MAKAASFNIVGFASYTAENTINSTTFFSMYSYLDKTSIPIYKHLCLHLEVLLLCCIIEVFKSQDIVF